MDPLRILFVASEAEPFVKIGGLGDVAGSLPQALLQLRPSQTRNQFIDVRLIIPLHKVIDKHKYSLETVLAFNVAHKNGAVRTQIYSTFVNGVMVYLVSGKPISDLPTVYSATDDESNGRKYTFFSLAVTEFIKRYDWVPHVIHANDWHSALIAYLLKTKYHNEKKLNKIPTLLTIHNLPFMGGHISNIMDEYYIPYPENSALPGWAHDMPLPLGLEMADQIVAVSQGYAREIRTPEYGCGLHDFFNSQSEKISGIINGLDNHLWNPETDSNIVSNFTTQSLKRREENRHSILHALNLSLDSDTPLLAMITRMDRQKGIDIGIEALRQRINLPWSVIILGTGASDLEEKTRSFEREYPDRVRALIKFNSQLSHQIYAGADILLMPSRYEPCGLSQMIAMRYGCIPIASAVGGLKDTIQDVDEHENGTGFLYYPLNADNLASRLDDTIKLFQDKERWVQIQKNAMKQSFAWEVSAKAYVKLYTMLKLKTQNPD
jgi:starch synthase